MVKEYLKDKISFKKYARRHYSQLETAFDGKQMTLMIEKLGIPISNTQVIIVGGYTGQFGVCI